MMPDSSKAESDGDALDVVTEQPEYEAGKLSVLSRRRSEVDYARARQPLRRQAPATGAA
jgi:hypothetical protein